MEQGQTKKRMNQLDFFAFFIRDENGHLEENDSSLLFDWFQKPHIKAKEK